MTRSKKHALLVVGIIGLAAIIRFWAIDGKPGYEWDEPVYTNIATHLSQFGVLQVKPDFGSPVEPYTYHPPFYFLLLSGWFKLVGAGVTSARVWAALMSLVAMVLTYLFARRYLQRAAIIPLVLMATDGWLVYCNRVSWIENTLLVIVIAAMWLYVTALDAGSRNRFLVAGLLIGCAAIFKHVGAYLIVVALFHWLIVRRYNRQHIMLFGVVAAVIALYLIGMSVVFGHAYWLATNTQFERTLGMHGNSSGSVHGIGGFLKPLFKEYYIFYATIIMVAGSVVLVVVRAVQVIRRRSFEVVGDHTVLFAWSVAALVFFSAINLRFPQYSLLVLPPLYLFASVEAVRFVKARSVSWQTAAVGFMVLLLALNALTYYQRIASRNDNVLADVQEYAEENLPPHSLVIAEEAVGDIIQQPYCKLDHVRPCKYHAPYVILYESFTQEKPERSSLEALLSKSYELVHFDGFKDTVAVYQVDKWRNSDAYPAFREHNELIRAENRRKREERLNK